MEFNKRLIIVFFLFLFVPKIVRAQYYYDPSSSALMMQLQQQQQQLIQSTLQRMNDYQYEIKPRIKFFTTDCKTLMLEIYLMRTVRFSNVQCSICNGSGSKTMSLSHEIFAGDILLKVGGQDWSLCCRDLVTICFDNGKKWTYTVGDGMTSVDWSSYYQKELTSSINKYKEEHAQAENSSGTKQTHYYTNSVQQTMPNQNSQASNALKSNQIDIQIGQIQRSLTDAQRSLSQYQRMEPGVTNSMLIQSTRDLISTYQRRIGELQLQKRNLGF